MKKLIILGLLLVLSGCASNPVEQKPFDVMTKITVTVHLVSNRSMIPYRQPVDGLYDNATNDLYMLCEMADGEIYPWSYYLAGHEFWHALRDQLRTIGNPDTDPRESRGYYERR